MTHLDKIERLSTLACKSKMSGRAKFVQGFVRTSMIVSLNSLPEFITVFVATSAAVATQP